MGIIRKTVFTSCLTGAAVIGYLGATTEAVSPLRRDDPIWRSRPFSTYNRHRNPTTQDIVTRRIPLEKIKLELLRSEKDLTVEFCRGVWAGLGMVCTLCTVWSNEANRLVCRRLPFSEGISVPQVRIG